MTEREAPRCKRCGRELPPLEVIELGLRALRELTQSMGANHAPPRVIELTCRRCNARREFHA